MKEEIILSGYKFKIQPIHGLDERQRLYHSFMEIFNDSIDILSSYTARHPLNPKDKSIYMQQSRLCKKKILDLKEKFIDAIVNLKKEQLSMFCLLIKKEIHDALNKMLDQLKNKFSYKRLYEHFRANVFSPIYHKVLFVLIEKKYVALSTEYSKRKLSR